MKLFLCGPGFGFSNTCNTCPWERIDNFRGCGFSGGLSHSFYRVLGANEQGQWEIQIQRMKFDPIHQLIRFTEGGDGG